MFFLVERDYYRSEYYCLKATLIDIGMVVLPLCILFSVGGGHLLLEGAVLIPKSGKVRRRRCWQDLGPRRLT